MDPKLLELRRLVVFEAIWGDETWRKAVEEALPIIEALSARNAVLEAENEKVLRICSDARDRAERFKKSTDELQERLSAAEEGNCELVRRAQKAEAELEREKRNGESWRLLADRMRIRYEEENKRADTLSAAGQVLSAHVDKADGECCHPVPMTHSGQRLHTLDCPVDRYPCSATCTHDDASTPGHPERVKERSEAVSSRDPEACEHNIHFQDTCGDCEYDRGAEAMRAACWEAAQAIMQKYGIGPVMREDMKRAIEGAAP